MIGDLEVKPTRMTLQLDDRSIKYPYGVVENVHFKVDKLIFLVEFVMIDIEEDNEVPLILGRPFMKTTRAIVDVDKRKLKVRTQDYEVTFNVFDGLKRSNAGKDCLQTDTSNEAFPETKE